MVRAASSPNSKGMRTVSDVVEVVITAPDADWLAEFARMLLDERLCAGGHSIERVRSLYRWQGDIHDKAEARIALHTRSVHVDAIISLANARHPYDVPCVVAWPIELGNPDYLAWVMAETRSS
ncbi:divalent-cation tolerance protein CutA [Actinokineospora iranica]|uniref:divalent-cation tolerance protein CutA n=1 Tax=Actinokineospora iranica TaxID=1271860 RepID=UPI003898F164